MLDWLSRTAMLLGGDAVERLASSRVAVFGIGGVGGFAAEALVRCGVGALDLIDNDRVSLSNINRQIIASRSTVGMYKTDAAEARFKDINPDVTVYNHKTFLTPETSGEFDFCSFDYIIDAIDTIAGKLALAVCAKEAGTPLISSMGAGNKLDPTAFEVADIYETSVCPLARVMRRELKKRGVERLKVVYSKEPPLLPSDIASDAAPGRSRIPGSVAFVPSVAGLIIAGEVVRGLILGPEETNK